ncbi:MAG: DUF2490 domain-containing protein [Bacteroidales bacterium]|nr:DUF2490 domain-containing protein [Bacteroidales bacterium]
MREKLFILSLFVLIIRAPLFAQVRDFGLWTTIEAQKEWNKWDFCANAEIRTAENSTKYHRGSFGLNAGFHLIKPLKLGLSYEYINFNDTEYADLQSRQRYAFYFQGKQRFGDFKIDLREKYQRTVKDERDRVEEDGTYDHYSINPEWVWRNRIRVYYNIPHFPINPSLSVETFYQLNNPDRNRFSQMRYKLALDYKLNKHNKVCLYGLIDQELDSEPIRYVGGLKYIFSF